jgi:hypothetical protein
MYKIKPSHDVDAVIVGYTETSDKKLDSFLLALKNKSELLINIGSVKAQSYQISEIEYKRLHDGLKALHVATNHKATNSNGVVYNAVAPCYVVTITTNDVLLETGGTPLQKNAFTFSASYEFRGRVPAPSALNLKLSRLRPDKDTSYQDVRVDQLYEIACAQAPEYNQPKHAKSEILKRDVYTRLVSGALCVRKILTWKTHKPAPEFAPYIVCYVDYSPTRKEQPIKRYVVPTQTEQQALEHFDSFVENNIKRGWELASTQQETA